MVSIMGIGIIALGIWLLLGISFTMNDIELFPNVLSIMIIIVGLVIVLRKVKSRELMIALSLWVAGFILELFQWYFFKEWIFIIALASTWIGLDHIAADYPRIKKYRLSYRLYLVVYIMMMLLSELILKTQETSFLSIITFLLILLTILLIILIYHMIKINHFLEEDYIQVNVQTLSYSFKKKCILIILSLASILTIIYMKDGFLTQIQQEVVAEEMYFLKVDQQDFKVLPFGYYENKKSTLSSKRERCAYTPIEIYIRQDLLDNLETIQYQIMDEDQVIVSNRGQFQMIEYNEGETTPFEDYVGGYIVDDRYEEIKTIVEEKKPLNFVLNLYDHDGKCYYENQSVIKEAKARTYQYEDDMIKITGLRYDMNAMLGEPKISFKDIPDEICYITLYTINDEQKENMIFLYDNIIDETTYEISMNSRFVHQPLTHLSKLKIEYRDEDYQIIDSYICELEEIL